MTDDTQDQRLTDAEYEVLCGVFAGRSTMPNDLVPAVNAILAARCPGEGPTRQAAAQALRDVLAQHAWQGTNLYADETTTLCTCGAGLPVGPDDDHAAVWAAHAADRLAATPEDPTAT